jgi:hypothetical protein
MKKTLELTLCESEGVKIEVSCEVLRIETDNPAIHPDSPNQSTIIEFMCYILKEVKLNGFNVPLSDFDFNKEIGRLIEEQLEENPELFDEE